MELSDKQLLVEAPSIFAKRPWSGVSARYAFIPTIGVVNALRDTGFVPVRASQSRCRIAGKLPFTKHMIRFRHRDDIAKYPPVVEGQAHHFFKKAPDLIEIVLSNAHDLSGAYILDAGMFRLVCSNGLVIHSANLGSVHIRHSGNAVEEVLRATKRIIEHVPYIRKQVDTWRSIALSAPQRSTFAEAALIVRYGLDGKGRVNSPVLPEQLLEPRRPEDKGTDLWATTNVIQENLMRGHLPGRSALGRKSTTRAITSVNAELDLNRSLWAMAEALAVTGR